MNEGVSTIAEVFLVPLFQHTNQNKLLRVEATTATDTSQLTADPPLLWLPLSCLQPLGLQLVRSEGAGDKGNRDWKQMRISLGYFCWNAEIPHCGSHFLNCLIPPCHPSQHLGDQEAQNKTVKHIRSFLLLSHKDRKQRNKNEPKPTFEGASGTLPAAVG
eukprot:TRINITY_DN65605_c0_g3_i1.p1 TRINITY_DN65605_c0_g3~~TRINITY_DN65605_c0_g3_i1.p1  ORF type:complete len:187 (+),score=2.13 TRINITY_DN65605_c0_g3_i1:83-562(+)